MTSVKAMPPMPANVLNAGTPSTVAASCNLPEDSWDLLGLTSTEAPSEREVLLKHGQVSLMSGADFLTSRRRSETDQRQNYRSSWQQQAEQRIAKSEAKKPALENGGKESGVMKAQKFTWSKDGQKAFEWRKIYHALCNNVAQYQGGLLAEAVISPASMRMYTDHRVMGAVVLPGVSHVSLMAATASMGLPSPGGIANDWYISIKETLFERPYVVSAGAELIAAIAQGKDPSTVSGGMGPMQGAMTPVGVPMTYCRASFVSKEKGSVKPILDWTK